jgi:hypothetical protein
MEMFNEEPSQPVKEYFNQIDIPIVKLREIYNLICLITSEMKEILDVLDPWQTHTYLNTSRDFEQIFDQSKMDDSETFAHKCEEFSKNYMKKKDRSESKTSFTEINEHIVLN